MKDKENSREIQFKEELVRIVSIELEKKIGDSVEKRKNGSSYIGFVNLVFENYELQHKYSENIEDYIYPIIR